LSTPPGTKGRRVALVIGAGSVKCAAALGLLKVLDREGIAIDMVVGCSGGSLYAAFIGLGAKILPCLSIGDHAVIGAGATVIRDVAGGATVVGTPARMIKTAA